MLSVIGSQADPAVAEITAGLSSLSLDKEVRNAKIKAAKEASTSPWDRKLTFDAKKHIASFLDAQDLFAGYQCVEKSLCSVSSFQTALELSDGRAVRFAEKLQKGEFGLERDVHFRAIADKVINVRLCVDQTDERLQNMLRCFSRLQEFSYCGLAEGSFLATLPPTIKRVSLKISNLQDKHLQCLQNCKALEVLEVSLDMPIGKSFSALPLSLHTLKLDCSYLFFENTIKFIELSPMRRLRVDSLLAQRLVYELIETDLSLRFERAKTIAQKVSHLDLRNGSEISEVMLVQTLPFFENLEELVLPSVEVSGSCLKVVPCSLKLFRCQEFFDK